MSTTTTTITSLGKAAAQTLLLLHSHPNVVRIWIAKALNEALRRDGGAGTARSGGER